MQQCYRPKEMLSKRDFCSSPAQLATSQFIYSKIWFKVLLSLFISIYKGPRMQMPWQLPLVWAIFEYSYTLALCPCATKISIIACRREVWWKCYSSFLWAMEKTRWIYTMHSYPYFSSLPPLNLLLCCIIMVYWHVRLASWTLRSIRIQPTHLCPCIFALSGRRNSSIFSGAFFKTPFFLPSMTISSILILAYILHYRINLGKITSPDGPTKAYTIVRGRFVSFWWCNPSLDALVKLFW